MHNHQTLHAFAFRANRASKVFRAINHVLRYSILASLNDAEGGKMTVTELYVKHRMEQSVCSQHLSILRKAQLVTTERNGKHIYYKANNDMISVLDYYSSKILNQFDI